MSGKRLAPGPTTTTHESTERGSCEVIGVEPYASREEFSKVSITFDSEGVGCTGWLYRPDRPRSAPLVVMGPGLTAERTFGYPALAEGLAERGVATFLFDYRRFGDSDGDPRGLVSIPDQLDDWIAAISRALELDGVDASRVALWGHSLGGGHALRIAAADDRVDAVVAHSPIVDGSAVLRSNGSPWLVRAMAAGIRDRVTGLAGRPNRIPIMPPETDSSEDALLEEGVSVGDGSVSPQPVPSQEDVSPFALLPDQTEADAFEQLIPLRSNWENTVPARVVLDLWRYRPGAVAAEIDVPTLLVTGADDPIVPASSVARVSRALSAGTFLALPTGHFALFEEPWRRRLLGHAGTFLADALGE